MFVQKNEWRTCPETLNAIARFKRRDLHEVAFAARLTQSIEHRVRGLDVGGVIQAMVKFHDPRHREEVVIQRSKVTVACAEVRTIEHFDLLLVVLHHLQRERVIELRGGLRGRQLVVGIPARRGRERGDVQTAPLEVLTNLLVGGRVIGDELALAVLHHLQRTLLLRHLAHLKFHLVGVMNRLEDLTITGRERAPGTGKHLGLGLSYSPHRAHIIRSRVTGRHGQDNRARSQIEHRHDGSDRCFAVIEENVSPK
jgi:hypothetical protein